MNKVEKIDKNYLVNKGNPLITARYSLDSIEQKFILAIISLIQPDDDDINTFSVPINTFYDLLGIDSANRYRDMKSMTKRLMKRVIEIESDNGDLLQIHWVSSVQYKKGEGNIEIEISQKLKPYLLHLKESFTSYYIKYILDMKKKYSIRLYEITRSKLHKNKSTAVFIQTLDELQGILEINYTAYDFKKYVLIPCIKEINSLTDIRVVFEDVKEKRKITGFRFAIFDKCKQDAELYGDM